MTIGHIHEPLASVNVNDCYLGANVAAKNTPVLRQRPHRNVVGRRHLEGEERKSNVCFAMDIL